MNEGPGLRSLCACLFPLALLTLEAPFKPWAGLCLAGIPHSNSPLLGSGRTLRGAKPSSPDAVATNIVGSELGAKLQVVVRDSLGHRDKNPYFDGITMGAVGMGPVVRRFIKGVKTTLLLGPFGPSASDHHGHWLPGCQGTIYIILGPFTILNLSDASNPAFS